MQANLFDAPDPRRDLDQHFTPVWAAEALVERYFADLTPRDLVLEPSCGHGAFLQALAPEIPAVGVEIDPAAAAEARRRTGRRIVEGDFRTVSLDLRPTALIGNPPFRLETIDGFLDRAHRLLPEGGRIGWILPAYAFQTPERVCRYAERWSLAQEMLPRTLFPGLSKPLVFALFTKDRARALVGFALYRETADVAAMPETYREALRAAEGSIWREAVARALISLGGEAELAQIYAEIAPRRPSATEWWREKTRQTLRRFFARTGPARYAIQSA